REAVLRGDRTAAGEEGPVVRQRPRRQVRSLDRALLPRALSEPGSIAAASGPQVCRQFPERLDVGVDRPLVVGDREGPLLLAAGGHEDAAVEVVEPGELGEFGVLWLL